MQQSASLAAGYPDGRSRADLGTEEYLPMHRGFDTYFGCVVQTSNSGHQLPLLPAGSNQGTAVEGQR